MTAKQFNAAIKAISNDDDSGFAQIYNEYYAGVYFVAFSIVRNKEMSEDIASNVFYKIYTLPETYDYIKNPKAWLYTFVRNEARNYIKKEQRYVGLSTVEEVAATGDIGFILARAVFEQILSEIAIEDKEMLIKYFFFGISLREIAKEMDIKYNTVKSKYLRAINKLKEKLSKE